MIIKVPMARFQGVAYNWIKATGTLRLDPDSALSANTFRTIAPLNNKVMELRKVKAPAHALPGSPERQHSMHLSDCVGWCPVCVSSEVMLCIRSPQHACSPELKHAWPPEPQHACAGW